MTTPASRSAIGRASGSLERLVSGMSGIQATGRFLRRQLWAWPIVAAVLFGGAGWWVHYSVEDAMREQRAADLNTMVDASATALRVWTAEQQINVKLLEDDERLPGQVSELLEVAESSTFLGRRLAQAKAQDALRSRMRPRVGAIGYSGYLVVSPAGVVIAADNDAPLGEELADYRKEIFTKGSAGQTFVSRPFRSTLLLSDENGQLRANQPTMYVIGPVRNKQGKPLAALGLRIRPEAQFTRILQVVRFGESGETYAFDRKGLLLSQSRFDDQLKRLGLLLDQPDARSILTVEVRDPQVDLTSGGRSSVRRADQPLTRLAAEAVQGKDGVDANGYRDYRGVVSVGAWRWLPEFDFGIATEVDVADAFRPLYLLRRAFWALLAMLGLSAVGIFLAMLFIARQQKALQAAASVAKQLGQYTLGERLGAGGMGTVYKAHHAMLRRPTAVKLLNADGNTEAGIARFEREVQLTSTLTHPNTVAVYDYGRTPDGVFYYAMEYLEGMNLEELVRIYGPMPEARVVYLLRQVCGALAEAHAAGMVHRDIKPANIFLTRRGGLDDFVKVLDFGLAKALVSGDASITSPNALMGTPLYLSPEAVESPKSVDIRSDVYAVGAVGYFLLSGQPVFDGETIMEICMMHVKKTPESLSARMNKPVTPALEALILRCLAKTPAERPASAGALLAELESCPVQGTWDAALAAAWWAACFGAATERDRPAVSSQASTRAEDTPEAEPTVMHETRGG